MILSFIEPRFFNLRPTSQTPRMPAFANGDDVVWLAFVFLFYSIFV